MFERFTDRARRTIVLAQEESRLLRQNYIGTEHLLLGLVHEGEGVAAIALRDLGVDLEATRTAVETRTRTVVTGSPGHIPFTARAKKVIELSLREALQLGHNYIGTEHVLLGLIREGSGVGAHVLIEDLGVDLSVVRRQVIGTLAGYSPVPQPDPTPMLISIGLTAEDIHDLLDHIAKQRDFFGPWSKRHPLARLRDAIMAAAAPPITNQGDSMGSETTTPVEEPAAEPAAEPDTAPEPDAAPEAAPTEGDAPTE